MHIFKPGEIYRSLNSNGHMTQNFEGKKNEKIEMNTQTFMKSVKETDESP